MLKRTFLLLTTILLAPGCLPIELGVSPDGKLGIARQEGFFILDPATGKATKAYAPAEGQPVFCRFAPDGKSMLAIVQAKSQGGPGGFGGGGGGFAFDLVNLADGSSRRLVNEMSNVTYTNFSPDGKQVSFTRVSDEQDEAVKQNVPELHLIDLGTGKEQRVKAAGSVAGIHRWFPDSKSILLFQIKEKVKVENNELYKGVIVRWDIAAGKATELAAALGGNDVFFDLSPNGKTVLFTAAAAGKPGADLKAGAADTLFELTIATGAVREVRAGVRYALWSKTGAAVLVGVKGDGNEKLQIETADAAMTKFQAVAPNAMMQAGGGMGGGATIYPSWIGDDKIAYLGSRAVYGTAGQNLELVVVGADGKGRKAMQAVVDMAAEH